MRSLLVAFCCSFLLLAACGGGGGTVAGGTDDGGTDGGGPDLFIFSGEYHTVGLTTDGTSSNTAFFGRGTADAVGGIAGTTSGNQDGVIPPLAPTAYTGEYTVDPDGSLVVSTILGGFGGMSEDRAVAAMLSFFGGMNVMVRRDGSYDASSLDGTYRFVGKLASSSTTLLSIGGTIVFDGAGAGTFMPEFLNNEGSLVSTADDPLSYTVTAQGDLEVDIRGLLTLTGGVARNGELIALAGGNTAGQDPTALYAVRQGSGASTARLLGEYTLVVDRLAQSTHDNLGTLGTLRADGSASAEASDFFTAGPPVSVPVAVSADGRIDITLEGGYRARGALSASGDVAFLAGGIDDGFDPGLVALVRKSVVGPSSDIPLDSLRSAVIPQDPPIGVGLGDRVSPLLSDRRITVGEVAETATVLGLFIGQGERALLQFDLSKRQPGRTVASAHLTTVQSATENAPFSLGSLQVDHVSPFTDFPVFLDFDPARRPLGTLGTLSDQPAAGTLSLDVTAAVKADIADTRPTSAFLLYFFPRHENGDNQRDRLVLDDHNGPGPTTGPRTRLVITYE